MPIRPFRADGFNAIEKIARSNPGAVRFYERHGFIRKAEEVWRYQIVCGAFALAMALVIWRVGDEDGGPGARLAAVH